MQTVGTCSMCWGEVVKDDNGSVYCKFCGGSL